MTRPTPRRLWKYLCGPLRLTAYFHGPGDGRGQPQIPAAILLRALLGARVLGSAASTGWRPWCARLRGARWGSRGASGTMRWRTARSRWIRADPAARRRAVRRAKRNKAFEPEPPDRAGLDGTGAGRGQTEGCPSAVRSANARARSSGTCTRP